MSLFWNWGSRTLLRTRPTTPINTGFPATLGSATTTSLFGLPGWTTTTTMALRYKSGIKTNSGCKKRFRVRGSGSIKRPKAGKSHNTGYLRRQRANRLGHSTGIEGKKIEQRVRKLLGVF
mmetsp:Transcript_28291/g.66427  ORF Transcript_28291/g.66427 Transcript_28291/m.66427 type:complete len:120 (-) Transcript_28291:207-566(-)